jgi:hypothetical protein
MSAYGKQSFAWHIFFGVGLVAAGAVMGIIGAFTGIAGLLFGGLGPIGGGVVNLVLGINLKRRFQQSPNEPRISPEAKSFLQELMRQTHTGWNSGHGYTANRSAQAAHQAHSPLSQGNTVWHQLGKHWGVIPKTPADVLPRALHDLLDTACFHYNRVLGTIEGARNEPSLAKISQAAKNGADEAIFAVLHQSAMMHRYPETITTASRDCEEKIRALKELADGLEKMLTQPVSISDRLGYTSAMDSVLEDVRLESRAREELRKHSDEEQHLRDRL